ncbi:MAG: 4-hydroxybenzoate 3-monooxygenase [Pseudomonadota bacterium]
MAATQKTQVVIIGAGPAGLLLSHLLSLSGIHSIVLERQSRQHVEGRIRAGVLEWGSVEILRQAGLAGRMDREGLDHSGFELTYHEHRHRIDLKGLVGKGVLVYGQTELTSDLMTRRHEDGGDIRFEIENVEIENPTAANPIIRYSKEEETIEIECDYVSGCDGFHGVARQSIPADVIKVYERVYPFGWLGLLTDQPPVAEELIYANHERGFALCSMRSNTRSRYYLQCASDDHVENWPDERFWEELGKRLDPELSERLQTGAAIEKSIAQLRSFVAEPMRYRNLFLAGDAAHIVPPTGAKGLNLAIADVWLLAQAFDSFYNKGKSDQLETYSETCLRRVWKVERFSWYLSRLMHHFPQHDAFDKKMQRAEFEYIMQSEAASRSIAENYVGLPIAVD